MPWLSNKRVTVQFSQDAAALDPLSLSVLPRIPRSQQPKAGQLPLRVYAAYVPGKVFSQFYYLI